MHNVSLHYVTLYDVILHNVTLHYVTLYNVILPFVTLHYVTLHYVTLNCVTLFYVTLHYVTLHQSWRTSRAEKRTLSLEASGRNPKSRKINIRLRNTHQTNCSSRSKVKLVHFYLNLKFYLNSSEFI